MQSERPREGSHRARSAPGVLRSQRSAPGVKMRKAIVEPVFGQIKEP